MWLQEFRWRVADDFSPQTLDAFVEDWIERAELGRETWGVWRDGELGGVVCVDKVSPIVASSHFLFKKSFWGSETTVAAVEQVFQEVFDTGIERIVSVVFRDNANVLGFARRLGFVTEGTLRKNTMRQGKLVDMVALGLLKADFAKAYAARHPQAPVIAIPVPETAVEVAS